MGPLPEELSEEMVSMDDRSMNAYMDQYEDVPKLSLAEWLQERYSNCLLIAGEKVGRDREGWLEDAYYIRLLIQQESAHHDRLPVPNSITGNILDHWGMLPGDVRQDLKDTETGFYNAMERLEDWVEENR